MYFCSRKRKGVANIEPNGTAADEDQEEEYSVERILAKRTRNNKVEYFLKWNGFDDKDNTWELRENLDCNDLINEFEVKARKRKNEHGRALKYTLLNSTVTTSDSSEARRPVINIEKEDEIDNNDTANDISETIPIPGEKIPEKIMGVADSNGQLIFMMKWKGIEKTELISAEEANLMCPQIVIKYYEEITEWNFASEDINGD